MKAIAFSIPFSRGVNLNLGKGCYAMLTTDLSEKYVRINLGE